jgi:hypothetical protein
VQWRCRVDKPILRRCNNPIDTLKTMAMFQSSLTPGMFKMAICVASFGIFSAPHINILSAPYPHSCHQTSEND